MTNGVVQINRSRNGETGLIVESLSKNFGPSEVLRGVSFEVGSGEFVTILGPSGCGKTTLLRIIAGLEPQSSGRIIQDGQDVSHLAPTARNFGIVFQSYALFPNMTVFDNVAYGLQNRRTPRSAIASRVREMLEMVGLEGYDRRYPAQLSGGQQQRVALARAIAPSPGLLLLDEPLSALDARLRVTLRREILNLQRRLGVTTILVTHDQHEALTMADRVIVMNRGAIDQIGSPEQIYREPSTPFVADFVGEMNAMRGTSVAPGWVRAGHLDLIYRHTPDTKAFRPGSAVRVCFRPEDVTVLDAGSLAPNAVVTQIVALDFQGATYRATLQPNGSGLPPFTAQVSTSLLQARTLALGQRLTVALPASRLMVFPES